MPIPRPACLIRFALCMAAGVLMQGEGATAQAVGMDSAKASALHTAPAAQRSTLVVLLDRIEPEYKAGAKYRSPAAIDAELAQDLARRMQLSLVKADADHQAAHAASDPGAARLRLTTVADASALPRDHVVVPVAYQATPMAIMRADTAIKSWPQLKGRTVCVAKGSRHAGMAAGRYGATEKTYPSVTDALIALRSGACDATVHDSAMLQELIRLPEWKKFSAQLPGVHPGTLALVIPATDTRNITRARSIAAAWKAEAYPGALVRKAVQNIAFEVYLEQDVPDCH